MNRTAQTDNRREDWKPMLTAIPLRNSAVHSERTGSGGPLRLSVPRRHPAWAFPPITWIVHVPDASTLELDPLGEEIWCACDGQTSTETIIERFARTHKLTFHESRVSVTSYLKELIHRGALAVAMQESAAR